jgi:hypothetical protein
MLYDCTNYKNQNVFLLSDNVKCIKNCPVVRIIDGTRLLEINTTIKKAL